MADILPPEFAGLIWSVGDDRSYATVTDAFWPVYEAARDRLFSLGIRIEKFGNGKWHVIFTPRYSREDAQQRINGIVGEVNALELQQAERRREEGERRARQEAERAEALAAIAEKQKETLAERLEPAVERARACIRKYGEFMVNKAKVRAAVERHGDPDAPYPLGINDLILLEESVRDTQMKSNRMFEKIRFLHAEPVDWSDDEVVDAVVTLTLDDSDHATVENSRGWNRPDSPAGHWCYAMLQDGSEKAKAAAIKLARTMVGKYSQTQLGRPA
jgi:hypothetical protein